LALSVTTFAKTTRWFELSESYSFEKYVQEFSKTYASDDEYVLRKGILEDRLKSILAHNSEGHSWKKGINHLSDRTEAEFRQLLGVKKSLLYASKASQPAVTLSAQEEAALLANLPASVDWRDQGIVSSVKDQGDCGSCWTFATAETIEAHWAIATGQLQDLSEQQILDCTPNPDECGGTGGCGGGTAELAMSQIIASGGLASEWTYPYQSYQGKNFNCSLNSNTPPQAMLSNHTTLPSNVFAPLINAVATIGPIAISVDASAWSDYEAGVFNGCNQTNPDIDHAVQLVGYGTDPEAGDYWIVRNSWSPVWGNDGYIHIMRTSQVQCGVDLTPSDGTGCSGGPSNVTVCGTCGILFDSSYPTVLPSN